jgi:nucleoside-diphosphate-sugar epimerase
MRPISNIVHSLGGTGFLGAWTLKELLERGFNVRAAIRGNKKADHLRRQFKEHVDKLEFTIVDDVTRPGAFDEAVKGVDAIIHSASPLVPDEPGAEPSTLIEPAVNGTVGILKSALKSPTVQRVVITSSVGTIYEPSTTPSVRTEVSTLLWYLN